MSNSDLSVDYFNKGYHAIVNVFSVQVALMRNDGTMYTGFYDRQLVVTVTSEPGSPSSTIPEDKQVIPDDNVLDYEITPGMSDLIIRISVSRRVFLFLSLLCGQPVGRICRITRSTRPYVCLSICLTVLYKLFTRK